MEDLKVAIRLLTRIEEKVKEQKEYKKKIIKAEELANEDKKNGKEYTYWDRRRELGCCSECVVSKAEIKNTLNLVRKITLDIESKL